MLNIKFVAVDLDARHVYCAIREGTGKASYIIERMFSYDKFIVVEPELANLLAGEIYSIYLEDSYTEKKSTTGEITKLTEEEVAYVTNLVNKACITLEYEELLHPPSVDEQIDTFIKEFFDEEDDPVEQTDYLADFFKELNDKEK